MTKEDILPIGTVLQLEGNTKKLMIVARAMLVNVDGEMKYFDYGSVLYPEGLLGENLFYFNQENIQNVCAKGVELEEEELAKETIFKTYQENITRRMDLKSRNKEW